MGNVVQYASLYELLTEAERLLFEEYLPEQDFDDFYLGDIVTVVADSQVPVMNVHLLYLAADNLQLGYPDDPLGAEDAYGMIRVGVYEAITNYLYEIIDKYNVDTLESCSSQAEYDRKASRFKSQFTNISKEPLTA